MKVTIKDVALASGYSVTTVSYALNGSSEIPKETKDKILKVAKDLNYVPNAYARALKSKKTYNIGVYIPDFDGPVHPKIVSGLASGFKKIDRRYKMVVLLHDDEMSFVRENYLDLAILMDPKISSDVILELSKIVPLVMFDKIIDGKNIYLADINNEDEMYELTKMLIERNLDRIGYVSGSSDSYHNKSRFNGFLRAHLEKNKKVNNDIIYEANGFTEAHGYNTVKEVLEKSDNLPFDALMCANDELAIGAMRAIKEAGYNVPNDVKVTGFDGIELASIVYPSLTTIAIDWVSLGEKIAKYSLDILKKKHMDNLFVITDIKIIERKSTK